jgi:two-component system NtrC family sensor kinase
VVQSLISNAIDASPEGGRVVVATRVLDAGIEIRVSDNGHGIAPAIRDRVFDPFFTTKAVGKGTGLGLSISYGIVKDHGGSIDFESQPGQGTQFTILIPVAPLGSDVHQLERAAKMREP